MSELRTLAECQQAVPIVVTQGHQKSVHSRGQLDGIVSTLIRVGHALLTTRPLTDPLSVCLSPPLYPSSAVHTQATP